MMASRPSSQASSRSPVGPCWRPREKWRGSQLRIGGEIDLCFSEALGRLTTSAPEVS